MAQTDRDLTHQERIVVFREAVDDVERAVNLLRSGALRLVDADLVGALDLVSGELYSLSRTRTQLEIQFGLFTANHEQRYA